MLKFQLSLFFIKNKKKNSLGLSHKFNIQKVSYTIIEHGKYNK